MPTRLLGTGERAREVAKSAWSMLQRPNTGSLLRWSAEAVACLKKCAQREGPPTGRDVLR